MRRRGALVATGTAAYERKHRPCGDQGKPMTRVAIAGLGAIGRVLARRLNDGLPGLALACAAARDRPKAQAWLEAERIACPLAEPEAFPAYADLAIECAPSSELERICRPMLDAGKAVMVL